MTEHTVSHANGSDLENAKKTYMLANNQKEIERMKNQHEWIKGSFGGLVKAPIDFDKKNQSILDSATADGTWLMDVRSLFPPETELIGFDIAPELYPPEGTRPRNVELVTADLLQGLPAQWIGRFDLVHQRFVFPNFETEVIREVLGRLMQCVKPGGWIQLVEPCAGENVSGPEPKWFLLLHKLANQFMRSAVPRDAILAILHEEGFVNINIESLDIVIGKHQRNKEMDARGRRSMRDSVSNMYPMITAEQLGMPKEEARAVLDKFEADMQKYRTAVRHVIIWAQRPE
uniref:N-methyltransferase verN n=1 Tax=Clonostachys rogersoniana TaxID=122658 RepID=VERN_CLORO|nr:RecName: Full=N-methyltransferase verN; AltName: Full=Verticillin biosynthesis cluster protein N [Clonostachys rogersoniana]AQZ42160.1 putative methyltransferase [Gliocladium sp.]